MGGALFQASGASFMTNTIWLANRISGGPSSSSEAEVASPAYGGALAVNGGTVVMDLCQVIGNVAQGGNGTDDAPAAPAFGGAIYSAASITAVRCSFSGNESLGGNFSYDYELAPPGTTGSAGAIYNLGTMLLRDCLVSSNFTLGGIPLAYMGSIVNGGNGFGGGIFNAGKIVATNCTIALNSAMSSEGRVGQFISGTAANGNALGGGLFNSTNGSFLGVNVTFASNLCNAEPPNFGTYPDLYTNGFAAGAEIANTNGTVSLLNSVIACGCTNGNAYGTVIDLGDNISSDGTANFNSGSSYNFTDPLLGPLANNGGPTLTMALSPASPAIDFANSAGAPPDDQRGYARPVGIGVIDLGAYQYGATATTNSLPILTLSIARVSTNFLVSFTTSPTITNTLHFQTSSNLINWIDLQTIGTTSSPSNISETITPQGTRQQFFRLAW
jgi:hypothetical protein